MSRRVHRVPFFLACAITMTLGAGTSFATPPNLILDNSPGQPNTHISPMVRSYGDKVVAVWSDAQTLGSTTEPRIHYAVSTDSGATFTDLGAPPPPGGTGRWRGDPQLAVDPANGTFYIVGQAGTPGSIAIWVTRGTFAGPVLTWNAPVLARPSTNADLLPGRIALDCSTTGNVLHLLFQTGAGAIEYRRSTDGNGAVWSAPVILSSPADLGNVAYPQLAAGPGGAVHASWAGPVELATQPIRLRSSSDHGANWGVEETIITRMNPVIAGGSVILLNNANRPPYSMAVNRTAGSSTLGRVALAWGEPWDFTDEPFPALTSTFLRGEIEPNEDLPSATPFNVGEALVGALLDDVDVDCWSVSLAAGEPLLIWADSTGPFGVHLYVVGPDGSSHVNGYSGGPAATFAFRAPTAATYGIRVLPVNIPIDNSYRIRTRAGSPAPGEGRDVRDIAVACSTLAGWSIRRYPFAPSGYDDYLPTIGFAADGLDYVTWYDLSRGSLPGGAHLVVARNLAGTDPVASPPMTVTDTESSFNDYVVFYPPGIGSANDVYGAGRRVSMAWTDFRDFSTNAYAASLATDAFPMAFPNDTTVAAGTTATLHASVLNRNSEFEEKVFARVTGARSWPGPLVARDSVPVASTGFISIPIAIPDTAAAGPYTVTVTLERQSGIVLGSDPVTITIQSATGVGEPSLAARLEPVTPNPARGAARIAFTLARSGDARLEVFGLQGNRLRTLVHGTLPAGDRAVHWDGRDDAGRPVPAGLYFVTLEGAGFRAVRPLVMLK